MKNDFPLISELGLKVHADTLGVLPTHPMGALYFERKLATNVRASDLEKLLAEGVMVCAHRGPSNLEGVWIARPYEDVDSTHTGLLIGIKPIKRDTAEGLLREMIAAWTPSGEMEPLIERARRLLKK